MITARGMCMISPPRTTISAGIGTIVVHNTDSVFFTFNLTDPVTKEKIVGKRRLK
jgi:hypothetical protein